MYLVWCNVGFAVDLSRLERPALPEIVEKLPRFSAGAWEGDCGGMHSSGCTRQQPCHQGSDSHRCHNAGSQPWRQRKDRAGVPRLGQGCWISRLQGPLLCFQHIHHGISQDSLVSNSTHNLPPLPFCLLVFKSINNIFCGHKFIIWAKESILQRGKDKPKWKIKVLDNTSKIARWTLGHWMIRLLTTSPLTWWRQKQDIKNKVNFEWLRFEKFK